MPHKELWRCMNRISHKNCKNAVSDPPVGLWRRTVSCLQNRGLSMSSRNGQHCLQPDRATLAPSKREGHFTRAPLTGWSDGERSSAHRPLEGPCPFSEKCPKPPSKGCSPNGRCRTSSSHGHRWWDHIDSGPNLVQSSPLLEIWNWSWVQLQASPPAQLMVFFCHPLALKFHLLISQAFPFSLSSNECIPKLNLKIGGSTRPGREVDT